MRRPPPWLLVVGAAVSVQFGAAIAATLFDDLGASGVSLLRLGFAAPVLLLVWRPRLGDYEREDLALAAAFGLVLGAMNFFFYLALDRIPLGVAVTIEFAGPLAVGVLLSRRPLDVAFALLAGGGIVLLASGGGGEDGGLDPLGLLFVGIAAACWAAYILLAQRAGQRFTGGRGLALASGVAVLVPLVPGIVAGGSALLDPLLLLAGFGVALLSSVIPYSLEAESLRHLPANVFGVLMSVEPAIAAVSGFAILGQSLGLRDCAAIACVIAASVGITRGARPSDPVPLDA